MVCSTANLSEMLLTRPAVLDPAEATEPWFRLDAQLRAAGEGPASTARQPAQGGPPTAGSQTQTRGRRAAPTRTTGLRSRRRKGPSLTRFVLALMMVLAFLAWGPQLAASVGAALVELMRPETSTTACNDTSARAESEDKAGMRRDKPSAARPESPC